MRSFKHWTPRYIFDRAIDIWYQKRHPDDPWITPMAVKILESYLRPTDVGFEWGGGRSTLWFAKRVFQLTTIEHDPLWHDRIEKSLKQSNITNIDLRLRSLEGNENSPYVKAIESLPEEGLDFILVDGRLRAWCVLEGLPKLKPGGLMVIDDAHRHLPNHP